MEIDDRLVNDYISRFMLTSPGDLNVYLHMSCNNNMIMIIGSLFYSIILFLLENDLISPAAAAATATKYWYKSVDFLF